jgi:hypothetical protein
VPTVQKEVDTDEHNIAYRFAHWLEPKGADTSYICISSTPLNQACKFIVKSTTAKCPDYVLGFLLLTGVLRFCQSGMNSPELEGFQPPCTHHAKSVVIFKVLEFEKVPMPVTVF